MPGPGLCHGALPLVRLRGFGNLEWVQFVLASGLRPNLLSVRQGSGGTAPAWSPLMAAFQAIAGISAEAQADRKTIRCLLAAGANPNSESDDTTHLPILSKYAESPTVIYHSMPSKCCRSIGLMPAMAVL
jgi:hypothetical protein